MTSHSDNDGGNEAFEWTLYYHVQHDGSKCKGRAEFLRLLFEDSSTPYKDCADDMYGPTGMMDCFRGSVAAIDISALDDRFPFPVLFPPAIWHRPKDGEPVLINQVGACMIYLGDKLGYAPLSEAEKARANSIMLNALDYISEGRQSFHPVKNHMSYKDQKEQGDKVSLEFSSGRMLTFLHHFNKIVLKNKSSTNPIAGGEKVTYADFCLFHVLDATKAQFNSDFYGNAWDNANVTALKEYYEWIKSRPSLQAYFRTDRCVRKYSTLLMGRCIFVKVLLTPCFISHLTLLIQHTTAYAGDSMM
jgi:glutathione S-transferase